MRKWIGIGGRWPAFWNFLHARSETARAMHRGRRNTRNARESRYARSRRAGASALLLRRPENLRQFVGTRNGQLIVTAIGGRFIGPPVQESCCMPEAISLQMVVLHFAHELGAQRLPRQILARTPAALRAGHACGSFRRLCPVAP